MAGKRNNSQESVIERIRAIHGDNLDTSKLVYVKMKEKVIVICEKHGEQITTPNSLIYAKSGCPKCGDDRTQQAKIRSLESVLEQSKKVHNNFYTYDKVKDYTKTDEEYIITCPTHGDFKQNMAYHLSGRGCTKCGKERNSKAQVLSEEQVLENFKKAHGDRYKYPNINYKNCKTKIEIHCSKHGVFFQDPMNHSKGVGCPKCVGVDSKAEIEILTFLREYTDVRHSDRKIMQNRKEVDFFIETKNLAIEYNGLYYHSDKFQETNYHLDKTEACLKQDIKLIHIFEDEWTYKKEIVKSRLLNLIGFSENKIYARNCEIKEVDSREASEFLDENHIQGKVGAKIRIGLYYNNELVSIMTFGELRKSLGNNKKEGSFELLRFCNKLNTNVIGGASKLLKYFENNFEYEEIISYADRRWSNGDLYEKLDFDTISKTTPNYFYVRGDKREPRFKYRKDILVKEGYDKTKTEKEIMKERGYNRIYDCGSLKFIKTKKK